MFAFLKSLFRHFKLSTVGALLGANLICAVPFLVGLLGPLLVSRDLSLGMILLLGGFFVTGQAMAVSGRLLDLRFQKATLAKGRLWTAWSQGWAEGLVVGLVLVGLFSLAFNSVPFYWSQGTAFSLFSLVTLAVGSVLVLGGLPYFLPVRRREHTGLAASLVRAFRLMNESPALAAAGVGIGFLCVLANFGTAFLFPGLGGLAALHQGMYEAALEPRKPS